MKMECSWIMEKKLYCNVERERREEEWRACRGEGSSSSVARIHVCRDASGGEVLPDQPLRAIPVEVGGGVSDTGQVDTGWRERERERGRQTDEETAIG